MMMKNGDCMYMDGSMMKMHKKMHHKKMAAADEKKMDEKM